MAIDDKSKPPSLDSKDSPPYKEGMNISIQGGKFKDRIGKGVKVNITTKGKRSYRKKELKRPNTSLFL